MTRTADVAMTVDALIASGSYDRGVHEWDRSVGQWQPM